MNEVSTIPQETSVRPWTQWSSTPICCTLKNVPVLPISNITNYLCKGEEGWKRCVRSPSCLHGSFEVWKKRPKLEYMKQFFKTLKWSCKAREAATLCDTSYKRHRSSGKRSSVRRVSVTWDSTGVGSLLWRGPEGGYLRLFGPCGLDHHCSL